jgi:serpin B
VDFTQPATIKTINDWTSDKTHGKIPEILKGIDPFTHLILSNALYFKGYWTDPFIKELTTDAVFHTSTGSEQHVPTMRKMLTGVYSKLDNCAAVELSFGNGAFSLVVVLPDEGTSLSAVMEQMDSDWWTQVTDFETFSIEGYSQGIYYEVNLEIPRFKIEYERTLNNDLMAMGMKQPFDMETADFSLIAQTPLWVSDVLQKTFAQMDEDGMEAAAITIIPMAGSSGKKFTTIDFKVNRPFLYFLKEKSTGLIFFAGIMNKIS